MALIRQDIKEVELYERFEKCAELPRFLMDRANINLTDWQTAAKQENSEAQFILGIYYLYCQSGPHLPVVLATAFT